MTVQGLYDLFGGNLKLFREAGKMTRKELAEKMGVSAMSVYTWEAGRGLPSHVSLTLLEQALGVPAWELYRPQEG